MTPICMMVGIFLYCDNNPNPVAMFPQQLPQAVELPVPVQRRVVPQHDNYIDEAVRRECIRRRLCQ